MGMEFKINLMGADAMVRFLSRTPIKVVPYIGLALSEEAEQIGYESQNYLTPVHYGTLAGSWTQLPVRMEGNQIIQEFGYGGAASAYAMYIHELLESPTGKPINWTKAGSGAKYLENPTRKAIPYLEQRVRQKLMLLLKEVQ